MTDKLQGLQGQLNELQLKESAQLFINPNYELEKTLKVKSQGEITKKILHQVRTASAAETKQATSSSSDKGVSIYINIYLKRAFLFTISFYRSSFHFGSGSLYFQIAVELALTFIHVT